MIDRDMKVTIIFAGERNTHQGQAFQKVTKWEVHSTYNFLELVFEDGSCQQFNLDSVFSFSGPVNPVTSAVVVKKPVVVAKKRA